MVLLIAVVGENGTQPLPFPATGQELVSIHNLSLVFSYFSSCLRPNSEQTAKQVRITKQREGGE